MPLPAIIPLIGKIIASAAPAVISWLSAERTNQTNKELAEEQREWNDQQVDKQNAYNTPAAQAARMRDAGFNPSALGMGQGMSIAGNISASPMGYQLPAQIDPMLSASNSMLSMMSALNQGQDALDKKTLRQARLDEIQANTDNLKANALKLGVDADGQRIVNKYADEMNKWAIAGQKADYSVKRSVARLNDGQLKQINQDLSMFKIKVSQALADLHLTESEIENNYLNLDWVAAKIASTNAETKNIEANTSKTIADTELVYANKEKVEVETETAEKSLPYILQQYEATIANIKSQTGFTDEQVYWMVFDKMESQSLSIFGNRISQTRFGERKVKDAANRMIDNKLSNR